MSKLISEYESLIFIQITLALYVEAHKNIKCITRFIREYTRLTYVSPFFLVKKSNKITISLKCLLAFIKEYRFFVFLGVHGQSESTVRGTLKLLNMHIELKNYARASVWTGVLC